MMGIIFILLNLLMIFSAHLVAYRYFQKSAFSEQLVTTCLVYLSQITLSLLFLGVVVKNLRMPWILLLNGVISLAIVFLLRKTIKESIKHSYKKIANFSKEILQAKDFFLYLFVLLFVTQVVLLLIKIYYLPPHVWDVFAYHLHPVAEWTQQNMIPGSIDSPVVRINRNPMGSRLLHFWCFKFTNDIRWVELPQFIYGIIITLTAYSLLIKLNIKKNIALRYGILIYFIPLILIESRTCQDHLALTGTVVIASLYFINVFYERKFSQIIFLSLAFGLLLGIKLNSPQVILVFFLALLINKGWNRKKVREFLRKNRIRLLVGVLIILSLGGFWFFKTNLIIKSYLTAAGAILSVKFLLTGIILVLLVFLLRKVLKKFPVKEFLRKHRRIVIGIIIIILIVGSCTVIMHPGLVKTLLLGYKSPAPLLHEPAFYQEYPLLKPFDSRFLRNLLVFPFRIKDIGLYTSYTPDFLEKSGFGIQFFGFGLVAYLVMTGLYLVKRAYKNNIAGFILIFSVVLLLSYFFYYYSAANYRLFMFFPVFGMILWAYIVTTLDFSRFYLRIIDGLILVMILFNISTCFFEGNMHKDGWKTLLTIDNSLERTTVKYSFFFRKKAGAWYFIDQYMKPGEPLGYTGYPDSWVFPYFDNQLERRIYYLPTLPGYQLKKLAPRIQRLELNPTFVESLQRRGIHFIHINPHGARHLKERLKSIVVDDKRLYPVTNNLYYFKW